MTAAVCQLPLKDLVDNFTPGGCYGIEWQLSGDLLTCKKQYNPQWAIDGVRAKGLNGLYTESSSKYEFPIGRGFVGRAFAEQEVLFAQDVQSVNEESVRDQLQLGDGLEFLRADLAKEFNIHSAIFLPFPGGVVEVGSAAVVTSMPSYFAPFVSPSTPPLAKDEDTTRDASPLAVTAHPFLKKLVEDVSHAACYGIEWVRDGDTLKKGSHYNPEWRVEGVRCQGLKGLYTTRSAGYTFSPGEGLVGKAFADQAVLFIKDLQSVTPDEVRAALQMGASAAFLRADIAKEFGIHSAVFLPHEDGVLEVGSIQTVESFEAFLSEPAQVAIAGKTGAKEILSALQALAN